MQSLQRKQSTPSVNSRNVKTAWSEVSGWRRTSDQWEEATTTTTTTRSGRKESKLARMFRRHSTDGVELSPTDVEKLLEEFNGGQPVHPDVARYLTACVTGKTDTAVKFTELEILKHHWLVHAVCVDNLQRLMKQYDTEQVGHLNRTEVGQLLTDLNDGKPVPVGVANWIFEEADLLENGVITMPELHRVLTRWSEHSHNTSRKHRCSIL